MDSLINLNGIGEIGKELIEKLAVGIGWLATSSTLSKISVSAYIDEIKESEMSPLTKAAFIYNAKKTIKEYANQNDIVNMAIEQLAEDAKPGDLDNDWLGKFMDKARLVSSEEFQQIWAQILARECNVPGSIPVSLLYILERMDSDDAEAFTALSRMTVVFGETCAPIIDGNNFDYYSRHGINYNRIINLTALGLIENDLGPIMAQYSITIEENDSKVIYYDHKYQPKNGNTLNVGNVIYTKAGKALFNSMEVKEIDGFWEDICLPCFRKK